MGRLTKAIPRSDASNMKGTHLGEKGAHQGRHEDLAHHCDRFIRVPALPTEERGGHGPGRGWASRRGLRDCRGVFVLSWRRLRGGPSLGGGLCGHGAPQTPLPPFLPHPAPRRSDGGMRCSYISQDRPEGRGILEAIVPEKTAVRPLLAKPRCWSLLAVSPDAPHARPSRKAPIPSHLCGGLPLEGSP